MRNQSKAIQVIFPLILLMIFAMIGNVSAEESIHTLCDIPVAADAAYVDLGKTEVKNYTTFAAQLTQFPSLTQVDMYESRPKRADMEMLSEQFPQIRFGWTLRFGTWTVRTDVTAFSTLNNTHSKAYHSSTFEVLKYCKDLQALDLGHNMVKDISFLRNFPHLKILILSDNCVDDLSPLADLKELEFVELFRNHITDLSPLANHEHLLDVNVCRNFDLKDASALLTCPSLERAWISYCGISDEQQAQLQDAFPDCEFNFTIFSSTAGGWREHTRYEDIVDIFASRVYHPWTTEYTPEDIADFLVEDSTPAPSALPTATPPPAPPATLTAASTSALSTIEPSPEAAENTVTVTPLPNGLSSTISPPQPSAVAAPTSEAFSEYRTLQKNMGGEDVLRFKLRLQELGYYSQTAEITDLYNSTAISRVKQYQRDLGVEETGIATPELQMQAFTPYGGVATPQVQPAPAIPELTEEGFLPAENEEYIYENETSGQWVYISNTLNVQITRYTQEGKNALIWYETEFSFRGDTTLDRYHAVSKNRGGFPTQYPTTIAQQNNLVLAFSDDFYGFRANRKNKVGIVIEDGEIISKETYKSLNHYLPPLDILAFFEDGSTKAFYCNEYSADELLEMGVTDTLAFGPVLLRNGELGQQVADGKYNSREPRCALGVLGPQHYLLITVEGRTDASLGIGLPWIATRMQALGVQEALNLDGGNTAALVFRGKLLNTVGKHEGNNYSMTGVRTLSSMVGIGQNLESITNMTDSEE